MSDEFGQTTGGAPVQETDATSTEHADATHMGTEEGGGVQRALVGDDTEERDAEERDHISGGDMGI